MTNERLECPICERYLADEAELLAHFEQEHPDAEPPSS
jgi:hypothetical protein